MRRAFLAVLLILIAYVFASQITAAESGDYTKIDTSEFNRTLMNAQKAGEKWAKDPASVALVFTGPFEGKSQRIERVNESAESDTYVTITVTEDGYMDDSVRGAVYFLGFKRGDNGFWVLESAGKKIKCWPGRGHEDFGAEPCK